MIFDSIGALFAGYYQLAVTLGVASSQTWCCCCQTPRSAKPVILQVLVSQWKHCDTTVLPYEVGAKSTSTKPRSITLLLHCTFCLASLHTYGHCLPLAFTVVEAITSKLEAVMMNQVIVMSQYLWQQPRTCRPCRPKLAVLSALALCYRGDAGVKSQDLLNPPRLQLAVPWTGLRLFKPRSLQRGIPRQTINCRSSPCA